MYSLVKLLDPFADLVNGFLGFREHTQTEKLPHMNHTIPGLQGCVHPCRFRSFNKFSGRFKKYLDWRCLDEHWRKSFEITKKRGDQRALGVCGIFYS